MPILGTQFLNPGQDTASKGVEPCWPLIPINGTLITGTNLDLLQVCDIWLFHWSDLSWFHSSNTGLDIGACPIAPGK